MNRTGIGPRTSTTRLANGLRFLGCGVAVDVRKSEFSLPIVSIVVPFWGYLIKALIYNWLNQKKELQWRL